jgi:hypothetical protein
VFSALYWSGMILVYIAPIHLTISSFDEIWDDALATVRMPRQALTSLNKKVSNDDLG